MNEFNSYTYVNSMKARDAFALFTAVRCSACSQLCPVAPSNWLRHDDEGSLIMYSEGFVFEVFHNCVLIIE